MATSARVFFFFNDLGIPEVFCLTGPIHQVAPAKPKQTHTVQIWFGFEHKTWGANQWLMQLHQLQGGQLVKRIEKQ